MKEHLKFSIFNLQFSFFQASSLRSQIAQALPSKPMLTLPSSTITGIFLRPLDSFSMPARWALSFTTL
jgi:hypothetical protein